MIYIRKKFLIINHISMSATVIKSYNNTRIVNGITRPLKVKKTFDEVEVRRYHLYKLGEPNWW